jgi:mono/diheme cytochrome c family protein
MLKAVTVVFALCAARAGAQEIKTVPLQPTSPASGQQMFGEYCAVCHGKDAKGGGPAAPALKKRPPDLTQLAQKHGGKYPEAAVENVIKGDDPMAAHGSREMPMWGDLLGVVSRHDPEVVRMRIVNLRDYIKSLQVK